MISVDSLSVLTMREHLLTYDVCAVKDILALTASVPDRGIAALIRSCLVVNCWITGIGKLSIVTGNGKGEIRVVCVKGISGIIKGAGCGGKVTVGTGSDTSGNGILILLFSSVNVKPITVGAILTPSLTTVYITSL